MTGIIGNETVEIQGLIEPFDIETMPIGLYENADRFIRIDQGKDLPCGVEVSRFRGDGCRVIVVRKVCGQ